MDMFIVLDTEKLAPCLFRICALLASTKPTGTNAHRQLLHVICWAPIRKFTEANMETCVACWVWLLAAREDLTIEVRIIIKVLLQVMIRLLLTVCCVHCDLILHIDLL